MDAGDLFGLVPDGASQGRRREHLNVLPEPKYPPDDLLGTGSLEEDVELAAVQAARDLAESRPGVVDQRRDLGCEAQMDVAAPFPVGPGEPALEAKPRGDGIRL